MTKPIVSVCTITYMHEKYIAETIEGVLMQEVNFPVEFIIADDCSPDETEKVVQYYIDNHPKGHWIKYTKHKENKGMNPNFVWALNQCRGKYIAICEGDDYWTDSKKLQKQVEFLEENEEFGGVASNCIVKYDDKADGVFGIRPSRVVKIKDMLQSRQFHTATFLYRNKIDLPYEFTHFLAGDTPLFLIVHQLAPIYYFNEITTVYRRGRHGLTATHNNLDIKVFKEYWKFLNDISNNLYKNLLKRDKNKMFFFGKLLVNIGSRTEKVYFNVFKTAQRYYFDISHFSPLKRVMLRIAINFRIK